MKNNPIIIAIDTSCDDTSVAITQGNKVLSNIIASQTELHRPYGGVFPTVAKQAHKENIDPTTQIALKRAGKKLEDIDFVAVTQGPGLAPSLEVGIKFALDLAKKINKPLIPINHIEGHVLSPLAKAKTFSETKIEQSFPVLSIVISGGHSQFILIKEIGNYEILGTTIDDACGECLDKVGRMLDLGYPAGPIIEKLAMTGDPNKYKFPLPMTTSKDYNLSFSGIKTFARNLIEKINQNEGMNKTQTIDFCASFQKAVFRHISYKLSKILHDYEIREIWLGGGVASNIDLRKNIRQTIKKFEKNKVANGTQQTNQKIIFRAPYTKKLCADNGAMIGVTAFYKVLKRNSSGFTKEASIDRKPNWKIDCL